MWQIQTDRQTEREAESPMQAGKGEREVRYSRRRTTRSMGGQKCVG